MSQLADGRPDFREYAASVPSPGVRENEGGAVLVVCVQVRDTHETKRLIETILACSNGAMRKGAT